ncbi:MAG: hypothetical protein KZQ96_23830 [Candidatus Thiodiazotropha sp. (ex Lucinoma borealis)]|nr:hypothetical protein [Candidatus Thiodiazotropha sp. (ex Lucinoma borealis)]
MNHIDELHEMLADCSAKLDRCVARIKKSKLDNEKNIKSIGHALAHLYDVYDAIYEFRPELKPEYLKEGSYDEAEMEKFSKLMYETESLRDNCQIEKAIELLANFAAKKPPMSYAAQVEHRIEYFKSKCRT